MARRCPPRNRYGQFKKGGRKSTTKRKKRTYKRAASRSRSSSMPARDRYGRFKKGRSMPKKRTYKRAKGKSMKKRACPPRNTKGRFIRKSQRSRRYA